MIVLSRAVLAQRKNPSVMRALFGTPQGSISVGEAS